MIPSPFDTAVMRINVLLNLFMKFADSLWSFGAGALMLAASGWVVTRIVTQLTWIYVRLNGISFRKAVLIVMVAGAVLTFAISAWSRSSLK